MESKQELERAQTNPRKQKIYILTNLKMDNDSYEKDPYSVYANVPAPDVIIGQPITSQPASKPRTEEPMGMQPHGDTERDYEDPYNPGGGGRRDTQGKGREGKGERRGRGERGRVRDMLENVYSMEGEQSNRDWATGLYYSVSGNPHKKSSCLQNTRRVCHDCCCVPCMMCSISRRLGDPSYLPFVPCTGPAVRFKVRILGGISGTICNDCLLTSCCWPCAVCQMHREMDDIGL